MCRINQTFIVYMRFILNYSWAILWGSIMVFLMLRPPGNGPSIFFEGFDKLAHCGSFFLLTAFILFGGISGSKGTIRKYRFGSVTLFVTGSLAFLTEAGQYYLTTTRSAEWWDIFADFVGIGMALFAYLLFYRKRY